MTAPRRQPGDEVLKKLNHNAEIAGISDITVCDFWAWAYSDILSNTNRGVFAETLSRTPWGPMRRSVLNRLHTTAFIKGKGIEVKPAAYLQRWCQKGLSINTFDIAKKRSWCAEANPFSKEISRPSFGTGVTSNVINATADEAQRGMG